MTRDAQLILVAGGLLAAGVIASALAARLRLPALVLFIGLGMLVGSDGLGWIAFDDYRLARLIGTVALVVILFEGGLAVGWRGIRPVLRPALMLAGLGTVLTAGLAGLAASWLFDFSLLEGLLLGAILAATDGSAVFALLRDTRLPTRLRRTLEGEAGFNDPVAVLLVLIVIELIVQPHYGALDALWFVVREIVVGVLAGVLVGRVASAILAAGHGVAPALVPVASAAAAAIAYGIADAGGGSGFLAVFIAGLALGNARVPERSQLIAFHAGLASLAEIGMFFALGLLVFPSQLGDVAERGIVLALIVALLARPLATAIATARLGFGRGERILLGWAGVRGAVPVVLATFPIIRGVPHSLDFFNIVFFAVLLSTALQGVTVKALAARLGLIAPAPP